MKKILTVVFAAIFISFCFFGCTQENNPAINSKSSEHQPPIQNTNNMPDEADLALMREYVKLFAQDFPEPFDSTSEFDMYLVGWFSFWRIYEKNGEKTDENGYVHITKSELNAFVTNHFGIEAYEFPDSLPALDADNETYMFYPVGAGPLTQAKVISETISGLDITFTVVLEKHDFETGKVIETAEVSYLFKIISDNSEYALQAVSARKSI